MSTTSNIYSSLITSEHNQRPNFMAVVNLLCQGVSDCTDVINSLPTTFTLGSAIGAQLDIVGQWIGQSRIVAVSLLFGYFGFSEYGGGADGAQLPFGEYSNHSIGGIFFNLSDTTSATTTLNDGQYTALLDALVIRNEYKGTAAEVIKAIIDITGVTGSYISFDTGTLFVPLQIYGATTLQQEMISSLDILPRPAGVQYQFNYP